MQTQMTTPAAAIFVARSGSFADAFSWVVFSPMRSLDHAHRDGLCHHFANLVGTISKMAGAQCLLAPLQWRSYRCRARSPVVPARKEIKNDLENSKNRGSSGGDGNQHVRLRGSQIAGCDNHRIRRRWNRRCDGVSKKGRLQFKDGCLRTAAFCGPPPCPRSSASPRLPLRCAFPRLFSCLVLHSLAGRAL